MEAEELWKELHYLFETKDGTLPEILIKNLSKDGVIAVFSYLQRACHKITNSATFWSVQEQRDKPLNSVPNAAAALVEGRAEPFHFVCNALTYDGEVVPDIGVFVFADQVNLDYRMGKEWNAKKLRALFELLKELKRIDAGATVTIEDYALSDVRKHFETIWQRFLDRITDA